MVGVDSWRGRHPLNVMGAGRDHISVCICTFKRPKLLGNLLAKLQTQKVDELFSYSVLVVDNDFQQSGKSAVESFKKGAKIGIDYFVEPEQNIALARNKAVENAKGHFVAFIDDDEYPSDEWLLNLYKAYYNFNTDGVLGPVKPHFESDPPAWVIRGGFCERESFKPGFYIKDHRYTRTGNVLFNKKIFEGGKNLFDPQFGKAGGEDGNFFKRVIQQGKSFVWCDEACV
jgi:glycosyltransferase involved in cell wall biosynthesis